MGQRRKRARVLPSDSKEGPERVGRGGPRRPEERPSAAVHESEARLRALIESMDDVAFEIDEHGTYVNVWTNNDAMLPRPREEMIGRRVGFAFGDEWAHQFYDALERVLRTGRPMPIEYPWDAAEGRRWFWGRVSRIQTATGEPPRVCVLVREITDRRRAEDALRDLSGKLLQAQDDERRRISRELHDGTSPLLVALTAKLYAALRAAEGPVRTRLIGDSLRLAEETAELIRSVSYVLHPAALERGSLTARLRWYVNYLATQAGIKVQLDAPQQISGLSEDAELALFRLVYKFLTSAPRRSRSHRPGVAVVATREGIALELTDEGLVLPTSVLEGLAADDPLAIAIAGMRERMRQLGGRLEVTSDTRGTRVRATLPLATGPTSAPNDRAVTPLSSRRTD